MTIFVVRQKDNDTCPLIRMSPDDCVEIPLSSLKKEDAEAIQREYYKGFDTVILEYTLVLKE